jgi:hypothetical protein
MKPASCHRLRTALLTIASLLAVQCNQSGAPTSTDARSDQGVRGGCSLEETMGQALLDEFAACEPGDSCQMFPIDARIQTIEGGCITPFLCSVPIRAGVDESALLARARTIVESRDACNCGNANCPIPETLEAFCDASTKRCSFRRKP